MPTSFSLCAPDPVYSNPYTFFYFSPRLLRSIEIWRSRYSPLREREKTKWPCWFFHFAGRCTVAQPAARLKMAACGSSPDNLTSATPPKSRDVHVYQSQGCNSTQTHIILHQHPPTPINHQSIKNSQEDRRKKRQFFFIKIISSKLRSVVASRASKSESLHSFFCEAWFPVFR